MDVVTQKLNATQFNFLLDDLVSPDRRTQMAVLGGGGP